MTSSGSGLLLVPTEMEWQILRRHFPASEQDGNPQAMGWRVELCGFGPLAAAATTARLLQQHRPEAVLLIGIAGAYDRPDGQAPPLPVGSASRFDKVSQYGVGVGSGRAYRSAGELGWKPIAAMKHLQDLDTIPLTDDRADGSVNGGRLLSCCSASQEDEDCRQRLQLFPDAAAEDMEGYAVAMACLAAAVPLRIIRGISNIAGQRDKSHWQIEAALAAAAKFLPSNGL